ncbi:MAG: restriction endonuclease subunit S, partial [Moorea sp. SIO3C2]|nr:restriction endonuclease subunit S [Moorena sp. SIO3C2]
GLQVTSKRKNNPMEIPYLRVANVYRDRLVLDEIKTIRVTEQEAKRTYLQTGDILIVEGHGNSTEIGRSSVWDGSIPNCSHQNHLIRVRIDAEKADSIYMSTFLNSPGGRRQLKKLGKTTSGLNTISTSNVKATKVLLPPLSEQENFVKYRQGIINSLNDYESYLYGLNYIFNSLLQKAFRGEL